MYVTLVSESRKCEVVEAADGRRFVLAKRKGVMSACLEGSDVPVVSGRGLSYKAIRRLLEKELSKEQSEQAA